MLKRKEDKAPCPGLVFGKITVIALMTLIAPSEITAILKFLAF
jgi:hypothetical protein